MEALRWRDLEDAAETGQPIAAETALHVLAAESHELPRLMAAATSMRMRFFGNRVELCSILNARSGACREDCVYCAQSAHHKTRAAVYPLLSPSRIRESYDAATQAPIRHYGIVTSGDTLSDAEIDSVCEAIRGHRPEGSAGWCASMGGLSGPQLRRLKEAGLRRYHHNLETAPSFFHRICTTHTAADRIRTLRAAKAAGLEICSGGLMGLGESAEHRVEFARTLADEGVDSIPMNFLVPIPGTPLEHQAPMAPLEIIKTLIMMRLMVPRADLRLCGGRAHLRDLQAMAFYAGASSMMVGPLLTVSGRRVEDDVRMVTDLGLEIA